MNEDGSMNEKAGKYNGMDRFECRKELVKDLQEAGVLVEIEPHMHSVGHSERSGAVVEPYLSTQWFVKWLHLLKSSSASTKEEEKVTFVPSVLKTHIYVGWKIFMTGVFLVNYGGDTVFQLGTIKKLVKYT